MSILATSAACNGTKICKVRHLATLKSSRALLVARKYTPEALVVAGVGAMLTGTVLACKQTLKVNDALEPHLADLEKVKLGLSKLPAEEYSKSDAARDRVIIYTRMGVDLLKIYAVPAVLMSLGAMSIFGAHRIMVVRNAGLAAIAAATDKAFKEYRGRVVEKFGEDEDIALRHGFEMKDLKRKDTDGNDVTVPVFKPYSTGVDGLSMYARWFDKDSSKWNSIPSYNQMFVAQCQDFANDMLHSRGHLFLNEVYDLLGLKRSSEGNIVGWLENGSGDGYVDFGLYSSNKNNSRQFVNGYESCALLDFNVDGPILEMI